MWSIVGMSIVAGALLFTMTNVVVLLIILLLLLGLLGLSVMASRHIKNHR